MWEYRAALPIGPGPGQKPDDLVHDGDTVKLLIDLGFDARTEKWIRLAGVRAPELTQPGGREAQSYLREWLTARQEPGYANHLNGPPRRWPLRVTTETTRTKPEPTEIISLTRYVGWVYDLSTGDSLNEALSRYIASHPEWPPGRDIA
jgi:hypothetical protein